MIIENRIQELGLNLPAGRDVEKLGITLSPAVKVGNLVFLSGHNPWDGEKQLYAGKLGQDVTEEDGYKAAQIDALACLSTLKGFLGDLDTIERVVSITGYVSSDPKFYRQPYVLNGASDLILKIFGPEKGNHSRAAIGVAVLPSNSPVELQMIVQIKE